MVRKLRAFENTTLATLYRKSESSAQYALREHFGKIDVYGAEFCFRRKEFVSFLKRKYYSQSYAD